MLSIYMFVCFYPLFVVACWDIAWGFEHVPVSIERRRGQWDRHSNGSLNDQAPEGMEGWKREREKEGGGGSRIEAYRCIRSSIVSNIMAAIVRVYLDYNSCSFIGFFFSLSLFFFSLSLSFFLSFISSPVFIKLLRADSHHLFFNLINTIFSLDSYQATIISRSYLGSFECNWRLSTYICWYVIFWD